MIAASHPGQNGGAESGLRAPLAGCRVLELSHSAGAVAGRALADLGAEVIKIEPPGGEAARSAEPAADLPNGERLSLFWLAFNVSKRSVCLQLSDPADRRRFAELARTADIVVTDFQRLKLADNDELAALARAANPALIWTEVWPFGRGKPYEDWPAGDLVLQALGGHLQLNGDIDRPPVHLGLPVALLQGGAEAASAALMAYYHRLRTGEGQRVDVSIQECITWTLLNTTMTWQLLHRQEIRGGAVRKERANKFYTRLVWPCADGYVQLSPVGGGGGVAREKSYAALLAWMAEEGITDPLLTERDWNGPGQFAISQEDYDAVTRIIARFIEGKTVEELINRAVRDRILLAPVSDIAHVLNNPHLEARGFYQVVHDGTRGTSLRYPGSWVRMSQTPLRGLSPAPAAGEHSAEILDVLPASTSVMSGAEE
jgi:crotonobetainyl-CoA:carnitine CoA-transferase CaiB-like acyl-CoA transferase